MSPAFSDLFWGGACNTPTGNSKLVGVSLAFMIMYAFFCCFTPPDASHRFFVRMRVWGESKYFFARLQQMFSLDKLHKLEVRTTAKLWCNMMQTVNCVLKNTNLCCCISRDSDRNVLISVTGKTNRHHKRKMVHYQILQRIVLFCNPHWNQALLPTTRWLPSNAAS